MYPLKRARIHFGKNDRVNSTKLNDSLFNTFILTEKGLHITPFLRVDMKKKYNIKTIIIDTLNYNGNIFKFIHLFIYLIIMFYFQPNLI